jgi:hypothetical protein
MRETLQKQKAKGVDRLTAGVVPYPFLENRGVSVITQGKIEGQTKISQCCKHIEIAGNVRCTQA